MALKDTSNPPRNATSTKHFLTQRLNDIAESLITPSDVLQLERPSLKQLKPIPATSYTLHVMDKRHPSSFQQLEKVYRGPCYFIVDVLES